MRFSILLTSLCSLTLIVSSCATVNEILGRDTTATTQKTQAKEGKPAKVKTNKRGKISTQTVTSPKIAHDTSQPTGKFSDTDRLAIIQQFEGEWCFDSVNNIAVVGDEDRPSLTFESGTCRFYANNGCNYFNGTFTITASTAISFGDVIATSNLCGDIPWADSITSMWYSVSNFDITHKGHEQYLELRDAGNRVIARLKRHSASTLNGLWTVTQIDGRTIVEDNPTLAIDLIEHRVHGNTGCNLVNGTIYQNPDIEMSIQFQNMAVTRMACPSLSTETALLVGLEQVEKAIVDNPDRIILSDGADNQIIVLERATL